MGIGGHLWTICKATGRSILYIGFGPLTLDFDFAVLKKKYDTFECFESVMGKSASMNFLFVGTEVGHQGDWSLPADF